MVGNEKCCNEGVTELLCVCVCVCVCVCLFAVEFSTVCGYR